MTKKKRKLKQQSKARLGDKLSLLLRSRFSEKVKPIKYKRIKYNHRMNYD